MAASSVCLSLIAAFFAVFIAGLRNRTTDDILVYADERINTNQAAEMEIIHGLLAAASKQARREQAASLRLTDAPETGWEHLFAIAEVRGKIFHRAGVVFQETSVC